MFKNMVSPLVMLQIVSFLDLMSIGLILPQLANHARQLGFSFVQLGVMGALYSACQTISAPIIGSLSDIRGTKPIFLLCLCICSLCYYWLGITSSVAVFFVLRGILGHFMMAISLEYINLYQIFPCFRDQLEKFWLEMDHSVAQFLTGHGIFKQIQLLVKAVVTEHASDTTEQGVLYGKLIAIAGFGMSAGPVISGHVLEAYPENGFPILTFIVGTMFALNTVLVSLVPFKSRQNNEKPKEKAVAPTLLQSLSNTLKESVNEFYKVDWPIFWDLFLYKMLMALTMGLYFSNFALFLKMEHDVSPKSIGYIVAFQGIVGALSNFLISYINRFYKNDTDYTQRTFHVFVVLTLSLIGLAAVPDIYMYIAILVPKSVYGSVGRVASLEMTMSRSNPSQKGAIMGASNSVRSMTGVITPIIGGIIVQYIGIRYAFYVAAFVNAIGVVVSYSRRNKSIKEKIKHT